MVANESRADPGRHGSYRTLDRYGDLSPRRGGRQTILRRADTGTLSPVSVVTVDTSQMVVVTMRELRRNSRPRPGGDTISAGFQAVSLLTLNSSYTVVSKWSWLR